MTQPFLQAVNISKRYGGTEALRAVDLAIFPGEVIGLVGDTNSGKSTLLSLIAGSQRPDSGYFLVRGKRVRLHPAYYAVRHGIKAVPQDINTAKYLNTLDFIFAGQKLPYRNWLERLGHTNRYVNRERASEQFRRLGFDEPPELDCPLHDLTSAERKMAVFVHATLASPPLLLLDEPMNSLESYKPQIFRLIERHRAEGGAVLLVTQNLQDIFRVSDRIMVLNAQATIAERRASETTEEEIVQLILGSAKDNLTPAVWALSNYFEVRRQAEALDRLNKAYERRAVRLQAHIEVARSISSILDRDQLLPHIVQIIQQRFNYYYTGIFLHDQGTLTLQSSACRDDHHHVLGDLSVSVGDPSLIGWCVEHGQAHLANDVQADARYLPHLALPATRAELVVPLRIGKRVLGVLDLQSDRANAFDEEDVLALQGLADQLAIAIRNADLFEAIQQARRLADEANRYKSVFLSNMSHELRTPLSVIIGHTQAMISPTADIYSTPLPDEYANDLETVRKNGEHLLALISDILDLSKIEAGHLHLKPRVIDLPGIFDDALRIASGLIHDKPVDLCRDYPPDLPPVWADSVRTQQIMINLLSNAIKFTEKGSITVRAAHRQDEIVVAVSDTGIGIPDHLQHIIFDRFHQGNTSEAKKHGGAGLGLSISQQLVELQHGRIWVESVIGEGTTISFTIPCASTEQVAAQTERAVSPFYDARRVVVFETKPTPATTSGVKLILHAQNESSTAGSLRAAMHDAGFVVEPTPINSALIEMAELMLPDLILLVIPDPLDITVARSLLRAPTTTHIPVVVLAQEPILPSDDRAAPVHNLRIEDATPDAVIQLINTYLSVPEIGD